MKKNQLPSGDRILKPNRETLRALTRAQMEHVDGGTIIATYACTGAGCARSNNSCFNGTCRQEN